MKYEKYLKGIIDLVWCYPGLSCARLVEAATRDRQGIAASSFIWKLRYLELAGRLECKNRKWYVTAERERQGEGEECHLHKS